MTLMPALYIGHGAPLLLDDPIWSGELSDWATRLDKPKAILIISAHWESAPLTLGSTTQGTPLIYDFGGLILSFITFNTTLQVRQNLLRELRL